MELDATSGAQSANKIYFKKKLNNNVSLEEFWSSCLHFGNIVLYYDYVNKANFNGMEKRNIDGEW